MKDHLLQVSAAARQAVSRKNWATVNAYANEILAKDAASPEGHFLIGLVAKAANRPDEAITAFARSLELDADRYDAAIELAYQHSAARRNGDAAALVSRYEDKLVNSPVYKQSTGSFSTPPKFSRIVWMPPGEASSC